MTTHSNSLKSQPDSALIRKGASFMKYADIEKGLNDLSDSELEKTIEVSKTLIAKHIKERKEKAIQSAAALLAEVGLQLNASAVTERKSSRTAKKDSPNAIPAGKRYANPADKSQIWVSGPGRRPAWVKELESKGQLHSAEA